MPELPEVETVRRGLEPALLDRKLVRVEKRRPDLRWPMPPDLEARTTGRRVTALGRRAKYLLLHLDDGSVMVLHLGMSGRILISDSRPETLDPHDHVIFTTEDGGVVRFNDARRFGSLDLTSEDALDAFPALAALGPEPLGNSFDGSVLLEAFKGKRTPLKAALLDQSVVAGLGNIYVCEALFRSGLSPKRTAWTVGAARADRLAAAIRAVLLDAIEAGGSSLRDHRRPDGELGYFQHAFQVYGREGEACVTPGCVGKVKRIVQSGRSTFHCSRCQR